MIKDLMTNSKTTYKHNIFLISVFSFLAVLAIPWAHAQQESNTSNISSPANLTQSTGNVTIGDLIYEGNGEITSQIVLEGPTIQTSFTSNGTISINDLNEQVTEIGTYTTTPRANGILYGEGKGVITGNDNDILTWTSQEIGTMSADGKIVFRGSMFFNSLSPVGKLAFLDNMPAVFSFEVSSSSNNIVNQVWELR